MTDCTTTRGRYQAPNHNSRHEQISFSFGEDVMTTLDFDAEEVTYDAGLVALREIDERSWPLSAGSWPTAGAWDSWPWPRKRFGDFASSFLVYHNTVMEDKPHNALL